MLDTELKQKILDLLGEHHVMAVATLRADGWPQTTMVGYVHDALTLYFASALISQKLANIQRDRRISIALGHEEPTRLRGLSMAAYAEPVVDASEIEAVNALMRTRYHERAIFSPRETASVLIRASPTVISVIDVGKGPGAPELVSVTDERSGQRIANRERPGGEHREVTVHMVKSYDGGYRPGAPP
ncbi:MAG: pyridoxamine 5'-phosphate oxidase family protein [Caulobacteraceae bacterium]